MSVGVDHVVGITSEDTPTLNRPYVGPIEGDPTSDIMDGLDVVARMASLRFGSDHRFKEVVRLLR